MDASIQTFTGDFHNLNHPVTESGVEGTSYKSQWYVNSKLVLQVQPEAALQITFYKDAT